MQKSINIFLTNNFERCLLEVKSCTLMKGHLALFPDAKTRRGRKHLEDLIRGRREDFRASILFLIQRPGAEIFSSHDEVDPLFGKTLRKAASKGVEILAYDSQLVGNRMLFGNRVSVELGG